MSSVPAAPVAGGAGSAGGAAAQPRTVTLFPDTLGYNMWNNKERSFMLKPSVSKTGAPRPEIPTYCPPGSKSPFACFGKKSKAQNARNYRLSTNPSLPAFDFSQPLTPAQAKMMGNVTAASETTEDPYKNMMNAVTKYGKEHSLPNDGENIDALRRLVAHNYGGIAHNANRGWTEASGVSIPTRNERVALLRRRFASRKAAIKAAPPITESSKQPPKLKREVAKAIPTSKPKLKSILKPRKYTRRTRRLSSGGET